MCCAYHRTLTAVGRLWFLGAFTVMSSCADNSFLELSLELPGRAGARQNAVVRALPGGADSAFDFALPWRGLEKNFVLLANSQDRSVSIEATREDVDLGLRVEFCATAFCEGLDEAPPAEAWFVIRRPFTIGARTRLRIEIPSIPNGLPPGALVIDCAGGSCIEAGTQDAAVPDAAITEDARVITQETGVSDAAQEASVVDATSQNEGGG